MNTKIIDLEGLDSAIASHKVTVYNQQNQAKQQAEWIQNKYQPNRSKF